LLVLFGGPAGAGYSTLAAAWCGTHARAVHIELDRVRELIVAGRADPQQPTALAGKQYALSVAASLATARVFLAAGYHVAIDDVEETLHQSALREKRVLAEHPRSQFAATGEWPERFRMHTTNQSIAESLARVRAVLEG
jgi:hypothetical protein